MHRLSQNARDFLRKSPVLGCCFATQRLFQVIGHVGSNKNAFAIGHFVWGSLESWLERYRNSMREITTLQSEQVCKPNSVSRLIGMTIIPLAQPLPVGSSDLPGGFGAGSPIVASLFGLAPRGVCLAAHVTTRAGALLLVSNLKSQI
jgi:hypothetical protein